MRESVRERERERERASEGYIVCTSMLKISLNM